MADAQQQFDEAMHAFGRGEFAEAARRLAALLAAEPEHFDARLALGMVYFRLGDLDRAVAEGHRAEQLRPREQLVHTNLSLFYARAGDKARAEHHALQARMASWRAELARSPAASASGAPAPVVPPAPALPVPEKFPDMPWKRPPPAAAAAAPAAAPTAEPGGPTSA